MDIRNGGRIDFQQIFPRPIFKIRSQRATIIRITAGASQFCENEKKIYYKKYLDIIPLNPPLIQNDNILSPVTNWIDATAVESIFQQIPTRPIFKIRFQRAMIIRIITGAPQFCENVKNSYYEKYLDIITLKLPLIQNDIILPPAIPNPRFSMWIRVEMGRACGVVGARFGPPFTDQSTRQEPI